MTQNNGGNMILYGFIWNTTYIVGGYFASKGVTVSEKIRKILDKETKTINV